MRKISRKNDKDRGQTGAEPGPNRPTTLRAEPPGGGIKGGLYTCYLQGTPGTDYGKRSVRSAAGAGVAIHQANAVLGGGWQRGGGSPGGWAYTPPAAATQPPFFDVFSDAFLERFWVDFGTHFGPSSELKCGQNGFKNQ